ncbi:MAG: hypothetical protein N2484_16160 [Clostridia bacterium]|nr:hypothetical protein [Clostridia bacterium]
MKKFFKFKPDRTTGITLLLGIASIALSFLLKYAQSDFAWFIIRDVFQISMIGLIFPFIILARDKSNFFHAGLRFDKPIKYVAISIILGALLSINFIMRITDPSSLLSTPTIIRASIIMAANIYELIFFFVFLTFYFEKAFGAIPAVILSSAFYWLHHIGFQPEFELFIIGIVFITIFRIAKHWLICIPLWWIGGLGDVLITSADSANTAHVVWWRSAFIAGVILIMFYLKYPFGVKQTYEKNITS